MLCALCRSVALLFVILPIAVPVSSARQTGVDTTRDTGPSWSPDGSLIGFSSSRDGDFDLYVIGADGTGLRKLSDSDGDDHYVAWSPDGERIAFISDRDGENRLYVMDVDGTNVRALAKTGVVSAPSWSPDSRRIAFQRLVRGELPKPGAGMRMPQPGELDMDIFVFDLETMSETNLTDNTAMDGSPVWSPGGEWIAFGSNRHDPSSFRNGNIYLMRPDGTDVTRLGEGINGNVQSWSPDGTHLSFGSFMHGNPEIYLVDADGQNVQRLTDNSRMDFYARISPDGGSVVLAASVDGNQEILVMSLESGKEWQLTFN